MLPPPTALASLLPRTLSRVHVQAPRNITLRRPMPVYVRAHVIMTRICALPDAYSGNHTYLHDHACVDSLDTEVENDAANSKTNATTQQLDASDENQSDDDVTAGENDVTVVTDDPLLSVLWTDALRRTYTSTAYLLLSATAQAEGMCQLYTLF